MGKKKSQNDLSYEAFLAWMEKRRGTIRSWDAWCAGMKYERSRMKRAKKSKTAVDNPR